VAYRAFDPAITLTPPVRFYLVLQPHGQGVSIFPAELNGAGNNAKPPTASDVLSVVLISSLPAHGLLVRIEAEVFSETC